MSGTRAARAGLALLLALAVPAPVAFPEVDPLTHYNLYTNGPAVRLARAETTMHAPEETDDQYRVLSAFDGDCALAGSSWLDPSRTKMTRVAAAGSVARLLGLRQVTRLEVAFQKPGLNRLDVVFTRPLELPLWAESLEFWSLGDDKRQMFRIVYVDDSGRESFLEVPRIRHKGWRRFSLVIPGRREEDKPFAVRYRRLRLTRLLVLDEEAAGPVTSRYHLVNLAASRVPRALTDWRERWQYRTVLDLEPQTLPGVQPRFFGCEDGRARLLPRDAAGTNGPAGYWLRAEGRYAAGKARRFTLRFARPVPTVHCRTVVLTLRGSANAENLYVLVRNAAGEHWLLAAGQLRFNGWSKLYVQVPDRVPQRASKTIGEAGLSLLEIVVEPGVGSRAESLDLGIARIGVVEDLGTRFFDGIELLDAW